MTAREPRYLLRRAGRRDEEFFTLPGARAYARQFPRRGYTLHDTRTGRQMPINPRSKLVAAVRAYDGKHEHAPRPIQQALSQIAQICKRLIGFNPARGRRMPHVNSLPEEVRDLAFNTWADRQMR